MDKGKLEKRYLEYVMGENTDQKISRALRHHEMSGRFSRFRFLSKSLKNYILSLIAYFAPLNSIRIKCHHMRGVKIGNGVLIGYHVTLDEIFPEYITIGDNVSFAGNDIVIAHSTPYQHFKNELESFVAPVVIGDGVWITVNVTILPGVTIGKNSIIGAGSIVNKDIPDACLAAGVPAKVIKKLDIDE